MRRLSIVVMLVLACGCSGVRMNRQYSELLDRTAALSSETADRAEAGRLSEQEMRQALRGQAKTWALFQDARDGIGD